MTPDSGRFSIPSSPGQSCSPFPTSISSPEDVNNTPKTYVQRKQRIDTCTIRHQDNGTKCCRQVTNEITEKMAIEGAEGNLGQRNGEVVLPLTPYECAKDDNGKTENGQIALVLPGSNNIHPKLYRGKQMNPEYTITMELAHELAILLDPEHPMQADWRMLASKFGITLDRMKYLERSKSPTQDLLQILLCARKPLSEIYVVLKQIQRLDAAEEVKRYLPESAQSSDEKHQIEEISI
ncbi:uncharacterized protein LOC144450328 isoform X1 [Glandiceps talaboti]